MDVVGKTLKCSHELIGSGHRSRHTKRERWVLCHILLPHPPHINGLCRFAPFLFLRIFFLIIEMSAGKAKRGAPAKIKKLMKRFGTEAGKLNEEDLKELMRSVDRAEPLPRDVRWVMNMADLNGDGNIQTGELALALVSASAQEHACVRVSAQCYGQCSHSAARRMQEKYQLYCLESNNIAELVQKFDADKDLKLSDAEMMNVLKEAAPDFAHFVRVTVNLPKPCPSSTRLHDAPESLGAAQCSDMTICEEQVTTVDVQYVRERYSARGGDETVYSFSRCLILGQLRSVLMPHQCFWSYLHTNPPHHPRTHMHSWTRKAS